MKHAIFDAVKQNDLRKASSLIALEPGCIREKMEWGFEPLHVAVGNSQLEMTRLLIESGADINAANDDEVRPLSLAVDLEVLNLLIDHGAALECRDRRGQTALWHQSSSQDSYWLMKRLLQSGADPNVRDLKGWSVLDIVATRSEPRKAILLRAFGAK